MTVWLNCTVGFVKTYMYILYNFRDLNYETQNYYLHILTIYPAILLYIMEHECSKYDVEPWKPYGFETF